MEFVEAVNPHYAVPIVGVIVCCLLVFAFGFKSPGQPPSFDIVDEERKVVKKRKGKENQKVKPQQNGKVTSAVPTKVETASHTPKTKGTTEKPSSKSESKQSSKKSRSQQVARQVEVGNKTEVVQSEDTNEDGWVQLVSKKERKNRKKDDVTPNVTDIAKAVPAAVEIDSCLPIDLEKSVDSKEDTAQVEKLNDTSDSTVEKESFEDTKATPKVQRTPKKKKGKKEEDVPIELDAAKEIHAPEVSESPKENSSILESKSYSTFSNNGTVLEPPADDFLQVCCEAADVSEEEVKMKTKKKKGKKKNQEISAVGDMKTETNEVHAQEPIEVLEQQTILKEEIIVEPKLISVELQDADDIKTESSEPTCIPGSNVQFDELKDLYSDEKPQKKKKKVRREH